jgi:large subunit ribosomal protein L10
MDNPRADKVAVVEQVRERLGQAAATVVTEYRGLSVAELADLRRQLSAAGGDYKIYKNTLVRLAIAESPHEPLGEFLTGPTAIAFVKGDVTAVAKALRDFARANPNLIVKGGLLESGPVTTEDLSALADLPSRDVLLARMAGAIAAPLRQFGGLLEALPRSLAYGLSALLDQRQAAEPAVEAPVAEAPVADEAAADTTAEAPADAEPTDAAPAPVADEVATDTAAEAPADESPAAVADDAPAS